jgi:hypothetical protein
MPQDEQIEAVVLSDSQGALYAVPVSIVQQWRLSAETAAALREENEVSGYIIAVLIGYQALGTASFTLNGGSAPAGQHGGTASPGTSLSLNFSKVEFEYHPL